MAQPSNQRSVGPCGPRPNPRDRTRRQTQRGHADQSDQFRAQGPPRLRRLHEGRASVAIIAAQPRGASRRDPANRLAERDGSGVERHDQHDHIARGRHPELRPQQGRRPDGGLRPLARAPRRTTSQPIAHACRGDRGKLHDPRPGCAVETAARCRNPSAYPPATAALHQPGRKGVARRCLPDGKPPGRSLPAPRTRLETERASEQRTSLRPDPRTIGR